MEDMQCHACSPLKIRSIFGGASFFQGFFSGLQDEPKQKPARSRQQAEMMAENLGNMFLRSLC
jgi:hypothetical protein